MANTYDIGDGVRLTAAYSIEGSGANPTTVTVTLTDPSGNASTPASGSGTDGVEAVADGVSFCVSLAPAKSSLNDPAVTSDESLGSDTIVLPSAGILPQRG